MVIKSPQKDKWLEGKKTRKQMDGWQQKGRSRRMGEYQVKGLCGSIDWEEQEAKVDENYNRIPSEERSFLPLP